MIYVGLLVPVEKGPKRLLGAEVLATALGENPTGLKYADFAVRTFKR